MAGGAAPPLRRLHCELRQRPVGLRAAQVALILELNRHGNFKEAALAFIIRPVEPADRRRWEPLWKGYQLFYKVDLSREVTEATWQRFFDGIEPVHALVAEEGKQLIGLVHYLFHRSTWMVGPICYLQDLFTAKAARGKGVGAALIEEVYKRASAAGSTRVYWNTHETNATARLLYDKVATRSGFIQYRKDV
jgi:GNAT superfamily N-acetyltransferase